MKTLVKALAVLMLLTAAPALAEPSREAVAEAIAGYELAVTRERLEALGPGWEQAVESLVRDPQTRSLQKERALVALGFSRTESSASLLREVVQVRIKAVQGVEALELRQAAVSLAAVEGAAAFDLLVPLLGHPVPDVREACARALAKIGGAEAALSGQLLVEKEPFVRLALETGLSAGAGPVEPRPEMPRPVLPKPVLRNPGSPVPETGR